MKSRDYTIGRAERKNEDCVISGFNELANKKDMGLCVATSSS